MNEEQPRHDMTGESNVALTKAASEAMGFLGSICKPAGEELGLMLADKVKQWRVQNQLRHITKLEENVKKHNIKAKVIHPKILYPYLEAIQFEDDEELDTLWVNLMTNYVDAEKHLTVTVYPSILKQISTPEARILQYCIDNGFIHSKDKKPKVEIPEGCIENLTRLGLIENEIKYRTESQHTSSEGLEVQPDYTDKFELTNFGYDFLNACNMKKNMPIAKAKKSD